MRQARIVYEIDCVAPDGYFDPELSDEINAELIENGPIPCEGRGPFLGCDGCRFCTKFWTNYDE